MKRLLESDKNINWYLDEMENHIKEIRELIKADKKPYRGQETCRDHAKVEAYDLIVLTADAFRMDEIIDSVPDEIIKRFNRKRIMR